MPEPRKACPLFGFENLVRGARSAVLENVVRASPSLPDFQTTTHMADYVELDLSNVVPAGTRLVLLRVKIKDDAAASYYAVRRKGDTKSTAEVICQVANIWNCMLIPVELDEDGVLEHRVVDVNSSGVSSLSVAVVGHV